MTYELLNIFEKPWLLLIIAVVAWMIITLIALTKGIQQRRWRLLLPLILALIAFPVDYFVKTDYEKIDLLITTLTESAATENIPPIDAIVAEDYSDISNKTKPQPIPICHPFLPQGHINKINRKYFDIIITKPTAICDLQLVMILNPNSPYAIAGSIMAIDTKLYLERSDNGIWQITSSDILKINNQTASWKSVR